MFEGVHSPQCESGQSGRRPLGLLGDWERERGGRVHPPQPFTPQAHPHALALQHRRWGTMDSSRWMAAPAISASARARCCVFARCVFARRTLLRWRRCSRPAGGIRAAAACQAAQRNLFCSFDGQRSRVKHGSRPGELRLNAASDEWSAMASLSARLLSGKLQIWVAASATS